MKQTIWTKSIGTLALGMALVGCTQYDSDQPAVTAGAENEERPTHGSATDIMGPSGATPTNSADRADIGIGGPAQRDVGNFEQQPLRGQQSDSELAKQIRVALTTGSMGTTGAIAEDQLTSIQVSSENGVVTLTGPVRNQQEKQWVEQRVADMKGVREVRNQLEIVGQTRDVPLDPVLPRTPTDQAID